MREAIKLDWIEGLEHPCADISISYNEQGVLELIMKFLNVNSGFDSNVKIKFKNPISYIWEDESYSHIDLPNNLPKCIGDFSDWNFPIIEVEKSDWKDKYESISEAYNGENNLKHFAFISMNDLVCVLSSEIPSVELIK